MKKIKRQFFSALKAQRELREETMGKRI